MSFKVLSLFDGMSCAQIAINKIGLKDYTYFASEIDQHAIKVTMANYPRTIQLGDVKKIKGSDLGHIDLIVGGSPCQGFSFSGKQMSFNDPRSALFFEYVRILNELKKINPKIKFLLENVKMKKEHENVISNLLCVDPVYINSRLVSAQNRFRIYWANFEISQPIDKNLFLNTVLEKNVDDQFYYSEKGLKCIKRMEQKRNKKLKIWNDDEKFECITASHHKNYSGQRLWGIQDIKGLRYITPTECEKLQTVPLNYTNHVSNTQRYKMLGNGFTVDVIAHILKGIL